jgi:hypothetical protein
VQKRLSFADVAGSDLSYVVADLDVSAAGQAVPFMLGYERNP